MCLLAFNKERTLLKIPILFLLENMEPFVLTHHYCNTTQYSYRGYVYIIVCVCTCIHVRNAMHVAETSRMCNYTKDSLFLFSSCICLMVCCRHVSTRILYYNLRVIALLSLHYVLRTLELFCFCSYCATTVTSWKTSSSCGLLFHSVV